MDPIFLIYHQSTSEVNHLGFPLKAAESQGAIFHLCVACLNQAKGTSFRSWNQDDLG